MLQEILQLMQWLQQWIKTINMKYIFKAIKRLVDEFEDIKVVYPIHKNPLIRKLPMKCYKKIKE